MNGLQIDDATKDRPTVILLHRALNELAAGGDVLLDDRRERAGVKFKYCDLIGYPHLNVKICATFALMRAVSGMVVLSVEVRQMIRAAYDYRGSVYVRFGRAATFVYHDENYRFESGKGEVIRDGKDIAIVATGILVTEAIQAA